MLKTSSGDLVDPRDHGYRVLYSTQPPVQKDIKANLNATFSENVIDYRQVTMYKIIMEDDTEMPAQHTSYFVFPARASSPLDVKNGQKAYNSFAVAASTDKDATFSPVSYNETTKVATPVGAYIIKGKTYFDYNFDDHYNYGELNLSNIKLGLFNKENILIDETWSDQDGNYSLSTNRLGQYTVKVLEKPDNLLFENNVDPSLVFPKRAIHSSYILEDGMPIGHDVNASGESKSIDIVVEEKIHYVHVGLKDNLKSVTINKQWKRKNATVDKVSGLLIYGSDQPPVYGEPIRPLEKKEFTISEDQDWSTEIENLHVLDIDQTTIEYNVEEVPVDGFDYHVELVNGDEFTIVNTFFERIDKTVTKEWIFEKPGFRDIYTYVQLERSLDNKVWEKVGEPKYLEPEIDDYGLAYSILYFSASETWKNLPKTDEAGKAYIYRFIESDTSGNHSIPDGFTVEYVGDKITNTENANSTSFTALKYWEGGPEEHPTIYFKLVRKIEDYSWVPVFDPTEYEDAGYPLKELKQGVTEATWLNIERYSDEDDPYEYAVIEVDKEGKPWKHSNYQTEYYPDGYNYFNLDYNLRANPEFGGLFTVVNFYRNTQMDTITAKKIWVGGEERPTVYFRLEASIDNVNWEQVPSDIADIKQLEFPTTEVQWENMPTEDAFANEKYKFYYKVIEVDENNKKFQDDRYTIVHNGLEVTNIWKPEIEEGDTITKLATKVWEGGENHPTVYFRLERKLDTEEEWKQVLDIKEITAEKTSVKWEVEKTEEAYKYRVREVDKDNNYFEDKNYITKYDDDNLIVTNIYKENEPGQVTKTAKKVWKGGKDHPVIYVRLERSLDGDKWEKAAEIEKLEYPELEVNFTVDQYSPQGYEYRYRAREVDETDIETVPEGYKVSYNGLEITNIYQSTEEPEPEPEPQPEPEETTSTETENEPTQPSQMEVVIPQKPHVTPPSKIGKPPMSGTSITEVKIPVTGVNDNRYLFAVFFALSILAFYLRKRVLGDECKKQ
ncbi:MAG: Cna B-type domain-containing protein [Eubacteriales bacterium]|nr:Cna B-type domain-containing protein [Eubacteriales bacterium]